MTTGPAPTVLALGYAGVVVTYPGSPRPHGFDWVKYLTGDIYASPELHRRLSALASLPHVQPLWLDEWDATTRRSITPGLGSTWPDMARPDDYEDLREDWEHLPDAGNWWKWWAVLEWMNRNDHVGRIIWCDQHFHEPARAGGSDTKADVARTRFGLRLDERVHTFQTTPSTGLTALQVGRIELLVRQA